MEVSLTTRRVKGSPLTNDELDDNFDAIADAIAAGLSVYASTPAIYVGDIIFVQSNNKLHRWNGTAYVPVPNAAADVSYSNTTSGLASTTVQAAIDELDVAVEEAVAGAVPVGTIIDFAGSGTPAGFLLCPTTPTTVSRTTYARLFAAIGTVWGAGDGSTTFGIPHFLDGYAAVSWPSNPGGTTEGAVQSHVHGIGAPNAAASVGGTVLGHNSTTSGATGQSGGNMAAGRGVRKCIRY